MGLIFLINNSIILFQNTTYADQNYLVAFLHALALIGIYVNSNATFFRHLQIIGAINIHILAKSKVFYLWVSKIIYGIFVLTALANLGKMILPLVFAIDFIMVIGITSIVLSCIHALPRVVCSFTLLNLILSMENMRNRAFYEPLKKELECGIKRILPILMFCNGVIIAWILVPILRSNSYIVYNINVVVVLSQSLVIFFDYRKVKIREKETEKIPRQPVNDQQNPKSSEDGNREQIEKTASNGERPSSPHSEEPHPSREELTPLSAGTPSIEMQINNFEEVDEKVLTNEEDGGEPTPVVLNPFFLTYTSESTDLYPDRALNDNSRGEEPKGNSKEIETV
jgi:hypothetical protein